jgi:glycosyltransferase involved in cell wall biosynthesis
MANGTTYKNAGQPDVSVVIPTRDRWPVLASRGLPAALRQEGVAVEVIVVDDGSTDPPPEGSALEDRRVKLIAKQERRGVGAARNAGIGEARGSWIAFLDDDDVWAPSKLASMVEAIEAHDADFGFSSALMVDDRLRPVWLRPAPSPARLVSQLLDGNVIPGGASNIVARRSIVERCGGFDENFSALADWDLWLRLADAGTAAASPDVLLAYRRETWVLHDSEAHRAEPARLMRKHEELARRHGVSLNWPKYEQWMGRSLFQARRRRAAARSFLATGLRHRDRRSLAWAVRALLPANLKKQLGFAPSAVRRPPAWLRHYDPAAR